MKSLSNKEKYKKILKVLKESERSEDIYDYTDGDGEGWGPALGAAADNAKEFNKELRSLIKFLKLEIKRLP